MTISAQKNSDGDSANFESLDKKSDSVSLSIRDGLFNDFIHSADAATLAHSMELSRQSAHVDNGLVLVFNDEGRYFGQSAKKVQPAEQAKSEQHGEGGGHARGGIRRDDSQRKSGGQENDSNSKAQKEGKDKKEEKTDDLRVDAKLAALPKEVERALIEGQKPFQAEIRSVREALKKADVQGQLEKAMDWDHTMVSVQVDGPDGRKMTVSSVGDKDLLVARSGDKTYLLNERQPLLDTVMTDKGEPRAKIDWAKAPELDSERDHQLLSAIISLRQQAGEGRHKERADDFYKSTLAVLKTGRAEGSFDDTYYAERVASIGRRYSSQLGNASKGLGLQEESLSILEKERGASDVKTMRVRQALLSDYEHNGKPADAERLFRKQFNEISGLNESNKSMSFEAAFVRQDLIQQLEKRGRQDDAEKVRQSAYDLVVKNPLGLPLNDGSLSMQRESLIKHYLEKKNLDKAKPLINDQVKAVRELAKENPESCMLKMDREQAISRLAAIGDKKTTLELLDDKRKGLDEESNWKNIDKRSLEKERVGLSKQYLAAGERNPAMAVAKQVMKSMDERHQDVASKPQEKFQERLQLADSLAGLSESPDLKQFSKKTLDQYKEYEQSEAAKKDANELASIRRSLIDHLSDKQNSKEAETLLEAELKYLNLKENQEKWRIPQTESIYADTLSANGKHAKAAEILERHVRENEKDVHKLEPLKKLAQIYEKLGKKEEAKKAAADAERIKKGLPPEHFSTPQKLVR